MAKLTSLLKYQGSLEDLTAYKLEGVEGTVVRRKSGPTKEQIHTEARYCNTRKNNMETGGCSGAVGFWLQTLGVLRPVVDQGCCGRLNALLKVVQKGDSGSQWGQRHVRLSQRPGLLEGFNLRKVYPLEGVIRNPLTCTVDRATMSATVEVPALLPGVNFFSPPAQPLYRIAVSLGVVPDLYYDKKLEHFFADPAYSGVPAQSAVSEWFPVKGGSEALALHLQLTEEPSVEDFSLVLTVGVQWGTIGLGGSVEVAKKVKSARIEKVG